MNTKKKTILKIKELKKGEFGFRGSEFPRLWNTPPITDTFKQISIDQTHFFPRANIGGKGTETINQ